MESRDGGRMACLLRQVASISLLEGGRERSRLLAFAWRYGLLLGVMGTIKRVWCRLEWHYRGSNMVTCERCLSVHLVYCLKQPSILAGYSILSLLTPILNFVTASCTETRPYHFREPKTDLRTVEHFSFQVQRALTVMDLSHLSPRERYFLPRRPLHSSSPRKHKLPFKQPSNPLKCR